ncbi:hypothetical protein ANN_20124 [Periplaneta americana]|uniref:Uncharacterized protein n=1 Tax=Periplaneta americana TaxID=6978 RepID=A0ABQ8SCV9_PERAM|nr:hypothetical protein ANN_20124 [Periplaneta americana]
MRIVSSHFTGDNEDLSPTPQESHKQDSSCGPKEKSRELNLATVVAKELDHLDLSSFTRMFGGDVRGRQVKSARVRHHAGTTFADVVPVANLHITLLVPLAGSSSTWNPLGRTWNLSSGAHWQELVVSSEVRDVKYIRSSNLFCIETIHFRTWVPNQNFIYLVPSTIP